MHTVKQSFADNPQQIVADSFDLIWVRCDGLVADAPFSSHSLQWLDWNLQGQIHRWWSSKRTSRSATFIPTFGKLQAPFVALDCASALNTENLAETCKGLGARQILILCKDASEVSSVEKEIRHQKFSGFPDRVVVGSDEAVGRS